MINRFFLAIAGVCLLVATGCNMQQGDANVRAILATACPQWADLEAVYDAIAAEGVISQSTANYAATAKNAANTLCANRETATVISVTAAGVRVYKMVDLALADAKRRGVSVGYAGDLRKLEGMKAQLQKGLNHVQ